MHVSGEGSEGAVEAEAENVPLLCLAIIIVFSRHSGLSELQIPGRYNPIGSLHEHFGFRRIVVRRGGDQSYGESPNPADTYRWIDFLLILLMLLTCQLLISDLDQTARCCPFVRNESESEE